MTIAPILFGTTHFALRESIHGWAHSSPYTRATLNNGSSALKMLSQQDYGQAKTSQWLRQLCDLYIAPAKEVLNYYQDSANIKELLYSWTNTNDA